MAKGWTSYKDIYPKRNTFWDNGQNMNRREVIKLLFDNLIFHEKELLRKGGQLFLDGDIVICLGDNPTIDILMKSEAFRLHTGQISGLENFFYIPF